MAGITATHDELFTLAKACDLFKSNNGFRPSPTSMWRWCRHGVNGVKLEYVRLGRRIFVTKPALDRFARELAEADQREDDQIDDPMRAVDDAVASEL